MTAADWGFDEPLNPYRAGEALSEAECFFNRIQEMQKLTRAIRVQTGGLIHLIGDYRTGKSSILLRFLDELEKLPDERCRDAKGRRIRGRYLTCETLAHDEAGSIFDRLRGLVASCAGPENEPSSTRTGLSGLLETLERLRKANAHAVLLIDEAGLLPRIGGAVGLLHVLPEITGTYPLHVVFASPFDLKKLNWPEAEGDEKAQREAAFDRLAMRIERIPVAAFAVKDAIDLIRFSERLYGAHRSLRGFEEAILDVSGTIPYLIQTTCREIYDILFEIPETKLDGLDLERRMQWLNARVPGAESADGAEAPLVNERRVIDQDPQDVYVDGEPYGLTDAQQNALVARVYEQLAQSYFRTVWMHIFSDVERKVVSNLRPNLRREQIKLTDPERSLLDRGYLRVRGRRVWLFSSLFEEYLRSAQYRSAPPPPPALPLQQIELVKPDGQTQAPDDVLARYSGVVPLVLREHGARCRERSLDEAGRDKLGEAIQVYGSYLSHLLTFFAHLAMAAYGAQAGLQQPEFNTQLRKRRYTKTTIGARLGEIREILRLQRFHDHDILHALKLILLKNRGAEEGASAMLRFFNRVEGKQKRTVNLLDFLTCAVAFRNDEVHLESKVMLHLKERKERLQLVWAGVSELLDAVARESMQTAIVQVIPGIPAEAERPVLSFRFGFGASKTRAVAAVATVAAAQGGGPRPNLLYPVWLEPNGGRGPAKGELLSFSLFPLVLTDAVLGARAGIEAPPPAGLFMVMQADKSSLFYAPVGNPIEGTGLEVQAGPGRDGLDPVGAYNQLYDGL